MKKFITAFVFLLAFGSYNGFSATTDHAENSSFDIELSVDSIQFEQVDLQEQVFEFQSFVGVNFVDSTYSVECIKKTPYLAALQSTAFYLEIRDLFDRTNKKEDIYLRTLTDNYLNKINSPPLLRNLS